MRLMTILAMAVMVAGSGYGKMPAGGRIVNVYLNDKAEIPTFVKLNAEHQAARMFAEVGITLVWKYGNPAASDTDSIAIELGKNTPRALAPGALAFALPYEGIHIRVFCDRIDPDLLMHNPAAESVLAHVMVHEVTHILQGVARHSREGIMKAFWSADDRSGMKTSPLRFAPEDVELIAIGMAARANHTARVPAMSAAAAAVSESDMD